MKKLLRLLTSRLFFVVAFIVLEFVLLSLLVFNFVESYYAFYTVSTVLGSIVVLYLLNNNTNPAYKIAWLIVVLLLPLVGVLFYFVFSGNKLGRRRKGRMADADALLRTTLSQNEAVLDSLTKELPAAARQSRYILQSSGCPVYRNTSTRYLPTGEEKFAAMMDVLREAKRFIFLEYFIISEGRMWDEILTLLREKVQAGVEVRVLFDDMGTVNTLPYQYEKTLQAMGIKSAVFNRIQPVLSARINNRDHRKICVVDGHTCITGGVNLADEYINEKERFGHWKDSSILLRGNAVWSLTVMFLSMWDCMSGEKSDFFRYTPQAAGVEYLADDGFVAPYGDTPLDDCAVGENIYLNLISRAEKYVYITTPYLVIDNEMITALTAAARSGVDVRILTPHIPDKWFVHSITRSFYQVLAEAGVRIYEYTPGFIHSKTFAVDDLYGVVGTINLDYRSLYLHFECAVWMYRSKAILEVRKDFEDMLPSCQRVTLEDCLSVGFWRRLGRSILRVFAPLM